MTPVRVFLIDDHPIMRQGIGNVLREAGIEVSCMAGSASEALRCLESNHADAILLDVHLGEGPEGDGIALLERILAGRPGIPCVVYSMREDAATIRRCLDAGAMGYVTKTEVWETLVTAIREAIAGRPFLCPAATRALGDPAGARPGGSGFSDREREVFRMLGEGFTVAEIGDRLGVGTRTVESYCGRILVKLGLSGMRELRRSAIAARKG